MTAHTSRQQLGSVTPKTRQYLHEDLAQIQRYFPGATPVALRTPFDLTPPRRRTRTIADMFRTEASLRRFPILGKGQKHWGGGLRWTI
jgi:hypothetical protein